VLVFECTDKKYPNTVFIDDRKGDYTMPLLTSPIDGSPMRQVNRYGIEIDVCPTTGGIWLDRGELEKLMMLIREEVEGDNFVPPTNSMPPQQRRDHDRYDDDRYKRQRDYDDDDYKYKKGYKKSKMSKIMDIFDF
jgi:uncharacterized protein